MTENHCYRFWLNLYIVSRFVTQLKGLLLPRAGAPAVSSVETLPGFAPERRTELPVHH